VTSDHPLTRTIASTATLKLAGIYSLDLFYTPLEERFERITRLARCALRVPVAGISLLDERKQWFKSLAGWDAAEIPRADCFCRITAQENALVTIPDTHDDPRVATSRLVIKAPRFRAYAGHPLADQHGTVIGTFCAFDIRVREFSGIELQAARDLAAMTQRELLAGHLSDAHAALSSKLGAARREALMDPLTRLWNRRGADLLLKTALSRADELGTPLTLALLDLDDFKKVNDQHGHPAGDEVLRKVAGRLLSAVRADDAICRVGGDEFLLLMSDTDSGIAARIAERIRSAVTDSPVPTRLGPVSVGVSVGYTVRQPRDPTSLEALVERADRALLASKAAGRNRVRMTP
jgi:diguanylate cyclase (GGDEF)-like protein